VDEREEMARQQAAGPYRPVLRALRRRRLRASLVQLAYVVVLFVPSVALTHIRAGPMIPATTMLFALAGALVSFIAIVYSLLFLVVQWASSAYSPRLLPGPHGLALARAAGRWLSGRSLADGHPSADIVAWWLIGVIRRCSALPGRVQRVVRALEGCRHR